MHSLCVWGSEAGTVGERKKEREGAQRRRNKDGMKQELKNGHPLICAMRAGDFTAGGHFIVIRGYEKDGFIVNDPNSRVRSQKRWTYEELSGQIKNMWYYQ